MRLLVVDESESLRHRLARLLRGLPGVTQVATADSLEQGLYVMPYLAPDLVVMALRTWPEEADWMLPRFKHLREGLRILVLSSDTSALRRGRCLQAGADVVFNPCSEVEQALAWVREQTADMAWATPHEVY